MDRQSLKLYIASAGALICVFGSYPITWFFYHDWYEKFGISDTWNDWYVTMFKMASCFCLYISTLFVQEIKQFKAITTISLGLLLSSVTDDVCRDFDYRLFWDTVVFLATILLYYRENATKRSKKT